MVKRYIRSIHQSNFFLGRACRVMDNDARGYSRIYTHAYIQQFGTNIRSYLYKPQKSPATFSVKSSDHLATKKVDLIGPLN